MSVYMRAVSKDMTAISKFTDWWLSGRGKSKGVEGAVDDCYISPRQHLKYINKYTTWICVKHHRIIGWAVMEPNGTLIHMLVAAESRGLGIGKRLMSILDPNCVRNKSDQSTGNPIGFYEKLGYKKVNTVTSKGRLGYDAKHPGRKKNIDILVI